MQTELQEALDHLPASSCSYEEWLQVGMALHHSWGSCRDWVAWSQKDPARFRAGVCEAKWKSFEAKGPGQEVTASTIYHLAQRKGWRSTGRVLAVEGEIIYDRSYAAPAVKVATLERKQDNAEAMRLVFDPEIVDEETIYPPGKAWDGLKDFRDYLTAIFEPEEFVGYVTECHENEDRIYPQKGVYHRTAGELIEKTRTARDMSYVVGDWHPSAGAWIRFNPVDGQGVKDANVTAYRYALVESDEQTTGIQLALIKALRLPIAALVHSAGKSIHAVVKIDARDYAEYRKRVDHLYNVCEAHGLRMDRQNRNPSRLSRMPGVLRDGRPQFLLATDIGMKSWEAWDDWVADGQDDLPEIVPWEIGKERPKPKPELIQGILRFGHKMLLAGPSKAGKSFALIQLCVAVAEGSNWFGLKCAQGRVLYVNLELDKDSSHCRLWDIYKAQERIKTTGNIDIWQLRGHATTMDKLAPKLIRKAQQKGYTLIVIDPIYKVLTGDENSAADMAHFTNQFDKIAVTLQAAVVFAHHHSKGAQGQKASRDRSSGSGVFSRDPDAIVDMVELELSDTKRQQICNELQCHALTALLDEHATQIKWRAMISEEDIESAISLLGVTQEPGMLEDEDLKDQAAAKVAQIFEDCNSLSAWRIETTLREFPTMKPINLWFKFPVHEVDTVGVLKSAAPEGYYAPKQSQSQSKGRSKAKNDEISKAMFDEAFDQFINDPGNPGKVPPSKQEMAKVLGKSERTIHRRVLAFNKDYELKNSLILPLDKSKK